jgi:hypothetical protein
MKKNPWCSLYCWVCVIFFARLAKKKFPRQMCHLFYLDFHVALIFVSIVGFLFGTWFFFNGFLFPIKELWLLTNPGHWMSLAPICILYCKQCMMWMNIEYVGFPSLGFEGGNLCVMCIFPIVSFLLFY